MNHKKLLTIPNIILVAVLLVLLCLPKFVPKYYMHLAILIIMYATLGTAWNWIGGFAGQLSLGNVVYFGLGAYASACSQIWWGLNPWLGLLLGMCVAAIMAILIGLPCFRLKGHYFAIATLAVCEMVNIFFTNWPKAGGAPGLYLKIRESSFLHFQFASKTPYFYSILALLIISTAITFWIKNSRSGYYFVAIKENPDAAKALGINIVMQKLFALVLSAVITAAVGFFWANYVLFIDPASVFFSMMSIQIALVVVLGGMGTIWGPILGACIIIPLSESSRMFFGGMGSGIDYLIYGALIIIVAVYQPAGLIGAYNHFIRNRKNRAPLKTPGGEVDA